MRLFIAVNFNDDIKGALASIQEQLKKSNVHGRYTAYENLHLTLAFIGEYGDPNAVLDALAGVKFKPFNLRLDGMGSFGSVWWAGIDADDELKRCASQVRHALAQAGIGFDKKRFSPHITLVREPGVQVIPSVEIPNVQMTVREISLMLSERGKRSMIYTELGTVLAEDTEGTV